MAFTTWQNLKTKLLDALADSGGAVLMGQSMSMAGRSFTFRSIADIISAVKLCDEQIALENGEGGMYQSRGVPK